MSTHVVTVTDFKANSASYLEAMEKDATAITITRRGRPVAVLSPPAKPAKVKRKKAWGSSGGSWAGRIKEVGDIVNYDATHLYDCLK
jgi:prevent-host-death family protein